MQDKHAAHPFRYIEICIYNWQLVRKLNKPKHHQIKISQIQIHIQFTRHVSKNQYYKNDKNIIFTG